VEWAVGIFQGEKEATDDHNLVPALSLPFDWSLQDGVDTYDMVPCYMGEAFVLVFPRIYR
jgi:hypothetical protein